MSSSDNRTRWNRSGLGKFEYVDGNAPGYLEALRSALAERFSSWTTLPPPPSPEKTVFDDPGETEALGIRMLLEQYHGAKRGLLWELMRAFSRSAHVLTSHVDAHANEGYLRTATQWEHVRRLVQMIDYRPIPATSASTQLAIFAKPGKVGTLPVGFAVKHSPPEGGPPIVFETLRPLEIDAALNELRPLGWDSSEDPNSEPSDPSPPRSTPPVANLPARAIQGVGPKYAEALDTLLPASERPFTIGHLLTMDASTGDLHNIDSDPRTWLREFRAKARTVLSLRDEEGWSDIAHWTLSKIATSDPAVVAGVAGQKNSASESIVQTVQLVEACLDQEIYAGLILSDLLSPDPPFPSAAALETSWRAPGKPKVNPGEVVIVYREDTHVGEAAEVAAIGERGEIRLKPSSHQRSWLEWRKGLSKLRVAPRWSRRAWLHGERVIRTREPHGLTEGTFVTWHQGTWRFAQVEEADTYGLRLKSSHRLPVHGTKLYEVLRLEGSKVSPDMEAYGVVEGKLTGVLKAVGMGKVADAMAETFDFPTVEGSDDVEAGSLPGVGGFLFPSPMLPIDLVKLAVELLLKMGIMIKPSTGEPVFKFMEPKDLAGELFRMLDSSSWSPGTTEEKIRDAIAKVMPASGTPVPLMFMEVLETALKERALLGLPKGKPVRGVVAEVNPLYVFDDDGEDLATGDWVVGRFKDGLRALQIRAVSSIGDGRSRKSVALSLEGLRGTEQELETVYADFRGELAPVGGEVNTTLATGTVDLPADVLKKIARGRPILLKNASDDDEPKAAVVSDVGRGSITIDPPPLGLTKGNLVIFGNVVPAGHGARKPAKILTPVTSRAGTALADLEIANASTVRDDTFPTGVRADVTMEIAGMVWEQVPRLTRSGPTDPHYEVRVTEDGFLRFIFGDGAHGRQLTPGTKLRIGFRVGAGRGGNLPSGSLTKPVHPHHLVEEVRHPGPSGGGEEQESTKHMRVKAPATLLALERCVSLVDFENLADARGDIWQAKAFHRPAGAGRRDLVSVVIVPAGGKGDHSVVNALQSYLQQHCVPGVQVRVELFSSGGVSFDVTVRVDLTKYDRGDVEDRVRAAMVQAFGIEHRAIGQVLYLSEVYRLVEGVEGVEDSRCMFRGTTTDAIVPAADEVVHLDPQRDILNLAGEAYSP